jgi:hypothetical protein
MKFLIIRSGPRSYDLDTTVVDGREETRKELESQFTRYEDDITLGDITFEVHRIEDGDVHQDFIDLIDERMYG